MRIIELKQNKRNLCCWFVSLNGCRLWLFVAQCSDGGRGMNCYWPLRLWGQNERLTVRHPIRLCSKGRWKARGSPHQSSNSVAAVWKFAGFCKCCKRRRKRAEGSLVLYVWRKWIFILNCGQNGWESRRWALCLLPLSNGEVLRIHCIYAKSEIN